MLHSGFSILLRSVIWPADLNGRSDNLDVIRLPIKRVTFLLRPSALYFMSYEINITTSTRHSVQEVANWMQSFPFQDKWNLESEYGSDVLAVYHTTNNGYYRCVISRPRRTGVFHRNWFTTQSTICIDTKVRTPSTIGISDTVFAVAFEFCKWDRDCDVLLLDNYDEVFVRTNGQLFVDRQYFRSRSLAAMLPDDYRVVQGSLYDKTDEERRNLLNQVI